MGGDVEIKFLSDEAIPIELNFEQRCPKCLGKQPKCDFRCRCNGTGQVPTELGKKVLSLIQNNLKVDTLGGFV